VAPFSGPTGQFQGLAWKLSAAPRRGVTARFSGAWRRLWRAASAGQARPAISSNRVKFRQAMSSFVKALLDGALCNFNALRGTALTPGPRRRLWRPTPLRPIAADEIRIARFSAAARNCPPRGGCVLRRWRKLLASNHTSKGNYARVMSGRRPVSRSLAGGVRSRARSCLRPVCAGVFAPLALMFGPLRFFAPITVSRSKWRRHMLGLPNPVRCLTSRR